MALSRKDARSKIIETHLTEHPNATLREIGDYLGVSRQRAYIILKLAGARTRRQKNTNQGLTKLELKILHCIASGNTNKEIGGLLNLSRKTIENRITVILAKLGAKNRIHAVNLARHRGLILLDEVKQ